ncbi:transporter substrate-binding domain-containing protein [Butyrivibrio sp. AC2005]|uniref:transporter substrate-binding domain-containing protein n=1 Tax=Butyrivibrio sp. AC2005 TaxID=1280672 RepID=UPI0003FD6039|nr:transporter substrate-binding domain-containing protein [Butyrivibrio sp. AC2005]
MKKLISTTLVLTMILTMCACGAKKDEGDSGTANTEAATTEAVANTEVTSTEAINEATLEQTETSSDDTNNIRVGVLTMLNMTENEMINYRRASSIAGKILSDEGYLEWNIEHEADGKKPEWTVSFYDTLDSMLMAINAGDIDQMMVYFSTGKYLCANNDNLTTMHTLNTDKEYNEFVKFVLKGHLSNDFAFLMMEGNEALRDEFSNAINDMKEDGTLDKLISEQIDALINGGDVKPVAMPTIDGAETIKVAVTGALPPMDYVAADGTPAGFNTAVLAEISQRIGKNIELVVVDSIGRSTALSSGTVDAVFWTRTNQLSSNHQKLSDEERASRLEKLESKMSDEEVEAFNKIKETIDFENYNKIDMPEGTICTVPYYSDIIVPVMKKK